MEPSKKLIIKIQKFENKTPLAAAQNNFQHDITKFLIQNGAI